MMLKMLTAFVLISSICAKHYLVQTGGAKLFPGIIQPVCISTHFKKKRGNLHIVAPPPIDVEISTLFIYQFFNSSLWQEENGLQNTGIMISVTILVEEVEDFYLLSLLNLQNREK